MTNGILTALLTTMATWGAVTWLTTAAGIVVLFRSGGAPGVLMVVAGLALIRTLRHVPAPLH